MYSCPFGFGQTKLNPGSVIIRKTVITCPLNVDRHQIPSAKIQTTKDETYKTLECIKDRLNTSHEIQVAGLITDQNVNFTLHLQYYDIIFIIIA